MQSRVLVIYGSFGVAGLNRLVTDWSKVDVVEMDALLPEHSTASKALDIEISSHDRADRINRRTRHLLDLFLLDRGQSEGLEVSRDFRAACLSLDAWRIISPYLLNLEIARELATAPKWSEVLVSPGAGISLLAWQQFADHLGIPIQVLPIAPHRPPVLWTLRRKWQRWRSQKSPAKASSLTQPLPAARPDSQFLCADPRLRALLAGSDWHQLPELVRPTSEEQVALVERYQRW